MNELTINLQNGSKKKLYEQIYEYVKREIQLGNIKYKDKLPSTRVLSNHLQVSRSTVELAYEQLVSEGYIEAIACKGYFVCQLEGIYQFKESKIRNEKNVPKEKSKYDYDFSLQGIDLENFPDNIWRKLMRNILLEDKKELFQLGSPKGESSLRSSICNYLYQARGVQCYKEQIIVGAGNDYLLTILSQLLGKNRTIAIEDPTYKKAYLTFRNLDYRVLTIPLDKNGIQVSFLEKTEADTAYVMPSHQFPLGIVMPISRRLELLNWASKREERYIIEDDHDSEFRYVGKPIPALQGYDHEQKVIYLGTFSNSIAPAIRVSYMVLPERLLKIYEDRKYLYTSTVSRIDQTMIFEFMNQGYFQRHLNRMRAVYKSKHDIIVNEFKKMKDICIIEGENAGLHLLVRFINGMSEEMIVNKFKEARIKVYPLSQYYIEQTRNDSATILLGFGSMSEDEVKNAVKFIEHIFSTKTI